jgi:hypothetical protein
VRHHGGHGVKAAQARIERFGEWLADGGFLKKP